MSGMARVYVGETYRLTAIIPGCRQHVGFKAMSDEEAIAEAAVLRAYHSICHFDPMCRRTWLEGELTLTCNDRIVSTTIGLADLEGEK